MTRIIAIIIGALLLAPSTYADVFTKSSDGAIMMARDSTGRKLTAIEAADTLVIYPTRFYDVYEPGYTAPLIFDTYHYQSPLVLESLYEPLGDSPYFDTYADNWLEDVIRSMRFTNQARQNYVVNYPRQIPFILENMTKAPVQLRATVDRGSSKIVMKDLPVESKNAANELGLAIDEKRWLHVFASSLQFSQAYISPNWYQGGTNSNNTLAQISWNVKLNEKFYPKLLFELNTLYKLGLNSAPNDTLRDYNITDDLFQLNSKFGYKARSNWYYSINVAFKTQFFNNYASNSRALRAAFMSPGEFNLGLGMTYSKATKRTNLGASINPLSYNLKTCINKDMNETAFGIQEGRTTVSQYGSNAEVNFTARLTWNISYTSRLFAFTNYHYLQADWQNTLAFNINRFLSTQFYWHLRYDTSTKRLPDSDWHRLQCKEIFTFGLSYRFSTT